MTDHSREKVIASWSISLDVDCPACGESFDIIIEEHDFLLQRVDPLEAREDYETKCPYCDKEFRCDFQY